jgi:hypothetical protein
MADDFASFDLTHECPSCGEKLTRIASGRTVELLHPQPVCPGFRTFVQRLLERQADQKAEMNLSGPGRCAVQGRHCGDPACTKFHGVPS